MQKCERCGRDNDLRAQKCTHCGYQLRIRCSECQFPNPADIRECLQCGSLLPQSGNANPINEDVPAKSGLDSLLRPSIAEKVQQATAAVSGQRREVSVLYLQIALPFDTIPESLEEPLFFLESEIVALFSARVDQFSGYVDANNGREAIALFGAPIMHENHAERAIQTAIDLQNELQIQFQQFHQKYGLQLTFRIGINTGHLLVGAAKFQNDVQYTIIGTTLKLAQELAARAEPSQILVSSTTWQLTHPLYRFVEKSPADHEEPLVVAIYKLLRKRREPDPVRGVRGARATMIGRRNRLHQLQRYLEDALYENKRTAVYIQGEAGIGKSRLIQEFVTLLQTNQSQALPGIVQVNGLAHTQTSPYALISELVCALCGIDKLTPVGQQQRRLQTFIAELSAKSGSRDDLQTYLGYLLGFPQDQTFSDLELHAFDAQMLPKLVHNAVRQLVGLVAGKRPLLIIFEDLHWADSVSMNCLQDLLNHPGEFPACFVFSSRLPMPETLQNRRVPTELVPLDLLSPAQCRELVHQLVAGKTEFERDVEKQIAERGAGNPFFVEEIIRMLIDHDAISMEGGVTKVGENALRLLDQVPGTLQALILTRFDRLDAFRQTLLRYASVLGDNFSQSLLFELLSESSEHVVEDLEILQSLQFLTVSDSSSGLRWQFRHGLIKDAIYATILRRHRERLHDQVAQILIARSADGAERAVQLIAYHLLRGKDIKQALPYLMEAAEEALFRSLNETAITYYQQIIDLVEKTGQTESEIYLRARIGLGQAKKLIGQYDQAGEILSAALQSLLGWSLRTKPLTLMQVMVKGFREIADIHIRRADYQTAISYLEAGIEALGANSIDTFPAMYLSLMERIIFVRFRQGKLDEALDFGEILRNHQENFAERDRVTLATVFNSMGGIHWQQGNYNAAVENVEKSLQIYTSFNYSWGRANSLSNLGILKVQIGEWERAEEYLSEALQLRQEIGDLHNEAFTHLNLGQLRLSLGDIGAAKQNLLNGLSILQQLEDNFGITGARILIAQISLSQHDYATAEKQALAAKKLADEIGGHEMQIEARWILAKAVGERGYLAEGYQLLKEAMQQAKAIGSLDAEADCLRIYGQLEVKSNHLLAAETKFRESIELSRQVNDPYRLALGLLEFGALYRLNHEERADVGNDFYRSCRLALEEAEKIFVRLGAKDKAHMAGQALKYLVEHPPKMRSFNPGNEQGVLSDQQLGAGGARHNAAILWLQLDLPAHLDDELLFETISFLLPACSTIAGEMGGLVKRRQDGLTIAFGVPTAFENDIEQAVLSAEKILHFLNQPDIKEDFSFSYRLVITYGSVIARNVTVRGAADLLLRGAPLTVAGKAAAEAPPHKIWVDQTIRLRAARRFEFADAPILLLGEREFWPFLKERTAPEPARGIVEAQSRFLGRDAAMKAMQNLVKNLSRNMGGIIWIEGEAGIGKSRLIREFRQVTASPTVTFWVSGCAPQRREHAFSLFADLLSPVFGLLPGDSVEEKRLKISAMIESWPQDVAATQPYLELLVGLRPQGLVGERLDRLQPEQLRQQIFVGVRRLLKSLAKQKPLVIIFDDLHWVDPISAELLNFLFTLVVSDRIMFVCAQRREGSDLPNDRLRRLQSLMPGQTVQLLLERLGPVHSKQLLTDLLPGAQLTEQIQDLIVQRSEGNPYFIEEFVRMLIEQGIVRKEGTRWQVVNDHAFDETAVPNTLDTLIRSRIDSLPPELKQTLQYAAVIGGEFELAFLARVMDDPNVGLSVDRLASRLMLQSVRDSAQWRFSHALYEAIVYKSMLHTFRQELHLRVAENYLTLAAADQGGYVREIAHHFLRAENWSEALPYLVQAGELAASQHATEEALGHFREAATTLAKLPAAAVDWRWRIDIGLSAVYTFIGKFSESMAVMESMLRERMRDKLSPLQVATLYSRLGDTARKQGELERAETYLLTARDLFGGADGTEEHTLEWIRTRINLAWLYFAKGNFESAKTSLEEAIATAEQVNLLDELSTAHNLLGGVYYQFGEWRDAFHHTTRAMVLREQMGYSWGVAATLSNMGILAFTAGHWQKAISFFERSLELREEMGDVEGIAITWNNLGNAYRGLGKIAPGEEAFRKSLETAQSFDMTYHIANASTGLAQLLNWQGNDEEAIAILENALKAAGEIGAQEIVSEGLQVKAEILIYQGQDTAALPIAEEAAQISAQIGNRKNEAGAWRMAAWAKLNLGEIAAAETLINRAKSILVDATDSVELGHLAAQAYRIFLAAGNVEAANAQFEEAKEIYGRLGSTYFLDQLTRAAPVANLPQGSAA
jgi:predicted ATPase/class 3 adenylate cyclase/Tfp pilus assembly protein PilF